MYFDMYIYVQSQQRRSHSSLRGTQCSYSCAAISGQLMHSENHCSVSLHCSSARDVVVFVGMNDVMHCLVIMMMTLILDHRGADVAYRDI